MNRARQARQTHRKRLALGRTLHSIRANRDAVHKHVRKTGKKVHFRVTKGLRKHEALLLRTLAVLGS